ncbi:hypothetical protein HD596_002970 [Nonomuraea jabiensis]|uniref:Uncharacterized protein n=1 Tax=Nonomuraea jabiensis TaxID=882448 RepID=A0A7W9G302_9ACTN|nr:hypothetical protein [Nonomuraea jabiensis]
MVGHDVRHSLRIIGPVHLQHPDAQTARRTDGLIGDEPVPGEPVALGSFRIADLMTDGGGTGQLANLAPAEPFARHHDDHSPGRVDDGSDQFGPQPPAFGDDRSPRDQAAQVVQGPFEAHGKAGQGLVGHFLRAGVHPDGVRVGLRDGLGLAEPYAAGDPTVVVCACVVVVVVVGGQAVPAGQQPGDGGFAGPLSASDPQGVVQGAERIPDLAAHGVHGYSIATAPAEETVLFCLAGRVTIVERGLLPMARRISSSCVGRSRSTTTKV